MKIIYWELKNILYSKTVNHYCSFLKAKEGNCRKLLIFSQVSYVPEVIVSFFLILQVAAA